MAELVRQVYSGRVVEGPGMLRGGTGRAATPAAGASSGPPRGVGEAGRPGEESLRITVSVDARTNSLLVVAPRAMFQEIKQLVEELDQAAGNQEEAVRVVPLHGVTAEAVQQALSAAAGDLAQFGARVPVAAPSTPAVPGKPAPRGQGAGVASGLAPRSQPARTPYSRGRPAAPDSAAVP
jgi:hypothetical protein